MATYFRFAKDDEYVKEHLTEEEIKEVKRWQSQKLDYEFSFHTQHEAGWPLYIIEPGQRGRRNRPKINLKEPTYQILEGKSLSSQSIGNDAKEVAKASLTELQKLASAYYEGKEEEEEKPVQLVAQCAVWKCGSLQCKGRQITELVDENDSKQAATSEAWRVGHLKEMPKCKTCKKLNWTFVEIRHLGINESADFTAGDGKKQI